MDTQPKTEKQLLDEIDYNTKEIKSYIYGYKVKVVSNHIEKIINSNNLIHNLKLNKILKEIEEIKIKYRTSPASMCSDVEASLIEAINVIKKNIDADSTSNKM